VEELEVGTEVYLPPRDVYEFLVDFPRYARYSKHLDAVETDGDGSVGTEYTLRFKWWKVRYAVRSRVTDLDPRERIEFELVRGLSAEGEWRVEPRDGGEASYVTFLARYDPSSVAGDRVRLPSFVSIGWVVDRAMPFIEEEAERVVERVVADLEGERRRVDLAVSTRTSQP
jgi:uncharacterized membrane protein